METTHKYRIGEVVETANGVGNLIPPDRYEIVRRMPPTVSGDNQYQVKSMRDRHERVVKESDLRATEN